MFGAKKTDLLAIWTELIDGGLESGHAYAKALRTVKSCVGTTWCRFGIGDSVGMAVRIEDRYKSIRAVCRLATGLNVVLIHPASQNQGRCLWLRERVRRSPEQRLWPSSF